MKDLINILKNFGLTEKQAKVYLAATKLGDALVSELGKEAGINRVSTYDVLEKLKERKLITSYSKKRMKYFSALTAEQLYHKMEQHLEELKKALPKFPKKTELNTKTRIEIFEEIKDLKNVFDQSLKDNQELFLIFDPQTLENFWPEFIKEFEEKRAKKGIFLKAILPENETSYHYESQDKSLFRSTKIQSEELTNQTPENLILISKSTVVLATLTANEIKITEIKDQHLAFSHLNLFQHLFTQESRPSLTSHRPKTALLKAIPEEELRAIDKTGEMSDNLTLF